MENGMSSTRVSENFEASIVYKYLMENGLIQTLNTFAQEYPHETSWFKGKKHKDSIPRLEDLVCDYQKTNQPRYAHYHLQALLQDYTELKEASKEQPPRPRDNKRKAMSLISNTFSSNHREDVTQKKKNNTEDDTKIMEMNNSLSLDEPVLHHILRTPKRKKLERRLSGRPVKPVKPESAVKQENASPSGRRITMPGEPQDVHNPLHHIDIDEALNMIEY